MKQWKLVLVALLSVLLVCTCMSALAEEATTTCPDGKHTPAVVKVIPGNCQTREESVIYCAVCHTKLQSEWGAYGSHIASSTPSESVPATCLTPGSNRYRCVVSGCEAIVKEEVVKATGHNWKLTNSRAANCADGWNEYTCQNANCPVGTYRETVKADRAHTWAKDTDNANVAATCTTDGIQYYYCNVCNAGKDHSSKGYKAETVKALGHEADKAVTTAATCIEDGSVVVKCKRHAQCGYVFSTKTLKMLGHVTVDLVLSPARCKTEGLKDVLCTRCNTKVNTSVVIPATGHKGKWVVTKAATAKEDGEQKLICQNLTETGHVCGEVLDKKVIKYTEMMYNNTITGYGPCTRDLIGGKTWNRVTPVDLSVDGTYTYDLVASNKYVVGTLVVTVANGTMTVNYELNANQIKVNEETLTIYANLDALKNGMGLTATVGTPIDVAANFGEDTKVIVAFAAKADYNAIGAGVSSFKADDAQLAALIANID